MESPRPRSPSQTSQTFGKKRQKAVTRTLQLMYLASAYPLSIEAKLVPRPGMRGLKLAANGLAE